MAVQFLLLTSQYLQGSQMSLQTWTTHGLAVKAALSIGLHAKNASTKFSPLEQEIRKRTWFGCVVLDRSSIYQLPSSTLLIDLQESLYDFRPTEHHS